jgi:dolichyl-diphosphooligosaccharide--protein glycosyltransferase
MSWYPLGRPVGSTIYPGMQFTAVYIKRYIMSDWSLNDVCCYIPAWFGTISTILVGCLTYECTLPCNCDSNLIQWVVDLVKGGGDGASVVPTTSTSTNRGTMVLGLQSPATECAVFSMAMMAIVPAHLMRSVGGGYDNESVAVTAMCATFYCWIRSLRNDASAKLGVLTGLAYFYMVAAWGGYIFVVNLIGVHACMLVATGRFSTKVYTSYSLFYAIGTSLAIQIPVVGWAPLKSLEQLGPCAVFLGFQLLQCVEVYKRKQQMNRRQAWTLRVQVGGVAAIIVLLLMVVVTPKGYFGPISSRVRGLFVEHTKTGNPLVDSVAEHQPASTHAYFQYLHHVCSLAPLGFLFVAFNLSDSSSFLLTWGVTAYFFSHRMVRLILLTAPIGSALGGIAAGRLFAWCLAQWWEPSSDDANAAEPKYSTAGVTKKQKKGGPRGKGGGGGKSSTSASSNGNGGGALDGLDGLKSALDGALSTKEGVIARRTLSCLIIVLGYVLGVGFTAYCWRLGQDLWNPTIIVKARTRDGRVIKLDDYREAYWWLRDNTAQDARIMAWWDYGYQITAIANRTTLADGNTWNHEHIALLGKALTAPLEEGYEIARHLADYVLVWGGGGGDDLAKSPHLARIANSVYRDHCPAGDPTCRAFGFVVSYILARVSNIVCCLSVVCYLQHTHLFVFVVVYNTQDREGTPSPMMERSFLYRLHGHQIKKGVEADADKFKEVYRSKYGRVRIFKILGIDEGCWMAG